VRDGEARLDGRKDRVVNDEKPPNHQRDLGWLGCLGIAAIGIGCGYMVIAGAVRDWDTVKPIFLAVVGLVGLALAVGLYDYLNRR
jgi:hypothetical protein